MRSILCICFTLCSCTVLQAQEYTLSYEGLPEMYTEVELLLLKNGAVIDYNTRKSNCKLTTEEAMLKNGQLSFDREAVYQTGGTVDFLLNCNGQAGKLTLQLPILQEIRFNLYADSIKPVMNYYLNVEGVYSNGNIYPLDTSAVEITADFGTVKGVEWIRPGTIDFEKVTFVAVCKYKHTLTAATTVYIRKQYEQ